MNKLRAAYQLLSGEGSMWARTFHNPLPLFLGLALLVIAGLLNAAATNYLEALPVAAVPLQDLFHEAFPPVDLNLLVSAVYFGMTTVVLIYFYVWEPTDFPLVLITMGSFLLVRDLFLVCTVLPVPSPRIDDTPVFAFPGIVYGTRDLFPSGHVGTLLVLSLAVRRFRWVRTVVFLFAILTAVGVLAMHVHYTIDVLGALFISYSASVWVERRIGPWARKS